MDPALAAFDPQPTGQSGCTCTYLAALDITVPAKGCPVHPGAYLRACAGCGALCDPDDMLEATFPERTIPASAAFPIELTVNTLAWVGRCCAALANRWQPSNPGAWEEP